MDPKSSKKFNKIWISKMSSFKEKERKLKLARRSNNKKNWIRKLKNCLKVGRVRKNNSKDKSEKSPKNLVNMHSIYLS